MKNFKRLITLAFVTFIFILNACNSQEELPITEPRGKLKSASIFTPNGTPQSFSLLSYQNRVGEIQVLNNNEYLRVEFIPREYLGFNNVQLWVGTSTIKVPVDKQKMPVVKKFKYKAEADDSHVFLIPLSEIYTLDPKTVCEAKKLYLFAHVAADILNTTDVEEISAWSNGTSLGNSKTVTYSIFTTKCKSTGGCFPHLAWGGNDLYKGVYYFDKSKGIQQIYTDNGEIAGWIKWESGKIKFSFSQKWMFTDLRPKIPLLEIKGYYKRGDAPAMIFSGEPTEIQGIYSVNSSNYPYYQIDFNLQYCY